MPPINASAVLLDHRVESCQILPSKAIQRGINGMLFYIFCRVSPYRCPTTSLTDRA